MVAIVKLRLLNNLTYLLTRTVWEGVVISRSILIRRNLKGVLWWSWVRYIQSPGWPIVWKTWTVRNSGSSRKFDQIVL